MARRNEAIADRASERVASIVAAAENSAAKIRADADAEAARARDKAISEASAEIQKVCSRLSDELQHEAAAVLARITGRGRPSASPASATHVAVSGSDPLRQPGVELNRRVRAKQIAHEVKEAMGELQNAATLLEHSLRTERGGADEPQPAGAA